MTSVTETLFLRRPRLEYVSPPVCEFDFSSTGGPVITLEALEQLVSPSGFILGGRGRFQLSWNRYPGAICYTVYKAVDPNNPFGQYVIVAECIEDPTINLEDDGPGCYRVSAITPHGETALSQPICEVGNCPFIISGAVPSEQTVNSGASVSFSCDIYFPGAVQSYQWFRNGVLFEDTTETTQEELHIAAASEGEEGLYTLVIEGNGCQDESDPAQLTVNAAPPCTHQIQVVGFLTAVALTSEGLVAGINDLGTRPFYHVDGVSRDMRTEVDSAPITGSQTLTTVTASADFFTPDDVDKFIEFSTSETAQITAFISAQQVTVTPSQSVAATTFVVRGVTLGGATGEMMVAASNGVLMGIEQTFTSGADKHVFWLDRNTSEIRDIAGNLVFPVAVAPDGFALLADSGVLPQVAYLYNPLLQTLTDLGNIGGDSTVPSINGLNSSHVAAISCNTPTVHACRWAGGIITDIHPAVAMTQPSGSLGISETGTIFGSYTDPVDFTDKAFVNQGGASVSMGDFGGNMDPVKINDSDMIVGSAEIGFGTGNFRAFIWTPGSGLTLIPQLGGTTAGSANDVNNDGWVVGEMDGIPFIYRDGVTEELFTLIPGGTLWTQFLTVDFVADNGWVSGFGIYDGGAARFLMQLCS